MHPPHSPGREIREIEIMTGIHYTTEFYDAVRLRINDGSYTDRYIARTDAGKLYLTDTGSAENKISTEYTEPYSLSEVIWELAPASSREEDLFHLAEVLERQGEFYHGDRIDETAQEWLDAGFDAEAALDWMIADVWQPSVAKTLVALDRTPYELRKIEDELIYAWCNGDKVVVWPTTDDTEGA